VRSSADATEIAMRISRPHAAKRQRSNDEDDVVLVPSPPSARPVVIALLSSSDDEEEAGAAATPEQDPPLLGAAAARKASAVRVKEERDGGWPSEFQVIREQPFDEADYTELRAWFYTEIDVIAGGRESWTRQGSLRVTQRVTGRTVRIAEWPQLRDRVQQMHEAGQHEQALQHLRCLKRYLQLVQHEAMPWVLRVSGSSTGFAEGEVVDLTTGPSGQELQRLEIDVDTVQGLILQNLAASSLEALEGALAKVKKEVKKEDTLPHPMQEGGTMTQVEMVPPGQAKKLEEIRQTEEKLSADTAAAEQGAVLVLEGAGDPSVNGYYRDAGPGQDDRWEGYGERLNLGNKDDFDDGGENRVPRLYRKLDDDTMTIEWVAHGSEAFVWEPAWVIGGAGHLGRWSQEGLYCQDGNAIQDEDTGDHFWPSEETPFWINMYEDGEWDDESSVAAPEPPPKLRWLHGEPERSREL
jgi:hypothetical protein